MPANTLPEEIKAIAEEYRFVDGIHGSDEINEAIHAALLAAIPVVARIDLQTLAETTFAPNQTGAEVAAINEHVHRVRDAILTRWNLAERK